MENNNKKVLLSLKDLEVKFRVRGRILTAIRGVSLDIYENESIAIVGESGSGKSVLTKTFAGMLDSNGYISKGELILNDDELSETNVKNSKFAKKVIAYLNKKLDKYASLYYGVDIYKQILDLKREKADKISLSDQQKEEIENTINDLKFNSTELFNNIQTLDPKKDKALIAEQKAQLKAYSAKIKEYEQKENEIVRKNKQALRSDKEYLASYKNKMTELKNQYKEAISKQTEASKLELNKTIAKEIYLSIGRYPIFKKLKFIFQYCLVLKKAMKMGADLSNKDVINSVFDQVAFRVEFIKEDENTIYGYCNLDLAKIKYSTDWQQIRGDRVATVFQDPMTSLNPVISIGKQITSIIVKHQKCSLAEATKRALELMKKVGITNPEKRFDDYPFQYSGGMRQRIVIAIALSCQPKILICDEPTTALDVTIQAQILKLIKDLQKEFGYTIVFITHDLGVVANIADRVAVLYAGQIVEVGTCEEVFYDPRHPYTWALLSSLPQLSVKGKELYSISGTPPSLYNKIVGDPFAPRNPYCLKIDTLLDSPLFKITETHYAKTWLLDPRAPKIEKPEAITNIHEKLLKAFNI